MAGLKGWTRFSPAIFTWLPPKLAEHLWTVGGIQHRIEDQTLVLAASVLMGLLALNERTYLRGKTHMYFQIVDCVAENAPDDAWVAAPQSGTLGHFHDRTIHLDGRVNPKALRARWRGCAQYDLRIHRGA